MGELFFWVGFLIGDGGVGLGVFVIIGLGDFLYWLFWFGGCGFVFFFCGFGVCIFFCWGVGVFVLFVVIFFLGFGVRVGGFVFFCKFVDIVFVFIVFVLRGGFFIFYVFINLFYGFFVECGIFGKMCFWLLLIGWVKFLRVDGC